MTTPGGTSWSDPDAVTARLEAQVAQAQQRAARAQTMRSEIDAVRGKGRSPRGEVVATADASGALTDLTLTDDALELSAPALAQVIVATAGQARRDAGDQAVRITAEAFGEDSSAVTMMRDELAQRERARDDGLSY